MLAFFNSPLLGEEPRPLPRQGPPVALAVVTGSLVAVAVWFGNVQLVRANMVVLDSLRAVHRGRALWPPSTYRVRA